jgi:hypothetical protein
MHETAKMTKGGENFVVARESDAVDDWQPAPQVLHQVIIIIIIIAGK